jgi:aerobic-type carbon monoxide dehydrogenase small subunit (CoxS/CutS family)
MEEHAFQCGYCTPGMILTTKRFLEENPTPSDEEIRVALGGNLCRCGCYVKIIRAVKRAAHQDF